MGQRWAVQQQMPDHGCAKGGRDEFNAQELMWHLQEQEGYEVYEFFEAARGPKGSRVLAPRRLWTEALEETAASQSASLSNSSPSGASSLARGSCKVNVDADPWIVLEPSKSQLAGPPKALHPPQCVPGKVGLPCKGKAPPPPPPPGGLKAKAKGPPGRPPAASAKGSASSAKAHAAAPPFGKRLHWKTLPDPSLEGSIFKELQPWGDAVPPLNKEQLEHLFSPAPRLPARDRTSSGGDASAGKGTPAGSSTPGSRKSGNVCLLTAKKAQNLAIVLRQVTLPTDELAEVLRWLHVGHRVSAETLEHVNENLIPALMECEDLAKYDGPLEMLRDIERHLLPLARLSRVKARVRTMMFSKNMPNLHTSLLARIRQLRSACDQIRNSPSLRLILEMSLRVGNYLNHGLEAPDVRGVEVRGIAIDSLLKLRDFRATQGGEASALHCIAMHLCPHHPELLQRLRRELQALLDPDDCGDLTVFMDGGVSDLHDSFGRFQSEVDLVQSEMERFGDCYRIECEAGQTERTGPLAVLQRLLEDAREIAKNLDEELKAALATARSLLEYFGERKLPREGFSNEANVAVEKFFVTLRECMVSFEDCWRDLVDNPRKLRLEGITKPPAPSVPSTGSAAPRSLQPSNLGAPSSDSAIASHGEQLSLDGVPSRPTHSASKKSPKAAAAAACAAAVKDASVAKSASLAAEAAAAAFRRRKFSDILRQGDADSATCDAIPAHQEA